MAWFRTSGNNGGSLKVLTASGDIASFETNLPEPLQSVIVDVEATGGNGTPDNPIPIVGYSEANITRCGVNFININGTEFAEIQNPDVAIPFVDGLVIKGLSRDGYVRSANVSYSVSGDKVTINTSSSSYGVGFAFRAIPNTDYYVSCSNSFTSTSVYYDKDGKRIGDGGAYISGNHSFTAPNNCAWCVIILKPNSINVDEDFNEPLVNVGTTKATYHAYNGQTYTVNFGQIVYGGQLIILPDRTYFHVTHGKYTGTWGDGGSEYLPPDAPSVKRRTFALSPQGANYATNQGKALTNVTDEYSSSNAIDRSHFYVYDNLFLYLPIATSDDTVIECSYVLATPFDIDLTPQQIEALLGINNVWHDANGDTEVKFLEVVRS